MYKHFNRGYLRTFSKWNQNVMYGEQYNILSKDCASYMNSRAILLNCRTVKENGGQMVVIRAA
jgi:hypothetical protein